MPNENKIPRALQRRDYDCKKRLGVLELHLEITRKFCATNYVAYLNLCN